ncbi:MAG: hypothetical protein COC05_03590 [Gammaproteobacteria bacterium]|nr:MAG: hypothetical protein COC05_03590 [Gammaproteobacteria bacterium]
MMYKQIFASCLIIVSTLACANDDSNATQHSAINSAQTNKVLHRNADGKPILRRAVIKSTAFREVEVGQTCGIIDKNGVELVCQPNAYCINTSDGSPGMCVAGYRLKKQTSLKI